MVHQVFSIWKMGDSTYIYLDLTVVSVYIKGEKEDATFLLSLFYLLLWFTPLAQRLEVKWKPYLRSNNGELVESTCGELVEPCPPFSLYSFLFE